jgi:hypothetical protein
VRIGDVIESIAQDRVHELVDEQGRHTGRPFAAESDVSRFQILWRKRWQRNAMSNSQFPRASASSMAAIADAPSTSMKEKIGAGGLP